MSHAVSELDRAPSEPVPTGAQAESASTITTFDGRRLNLAFRIDPLIDLNRKGPAGRWIQPCLTSADTGQPLTAAERMALLASDMERIDMATIDRGMDCLQASGGASAALILSMSFLSASSQRARTNLLLRSTRLQHRAKAQIVWLLSDLPKGTPEGRLTEVVALLRPFGRAVFAETELGGTAVKAARAAKLGGLVLAPKSPDLSPTDAAVWLLQAGKMAHRAAPALIADGVGSPALLPMAVEAGFTHAVVRERDGAALA